MRIFLLVFMALGSLYSQSQTTPILYNINSSGNTVFTTGSNVFKANEIHVGSSSYKTSSSAQVSEIAAKEIYAQPGFEVDNLLTSGYAELYIDPNLLPVGSFHQNGFDNIPQYDRFEIGVRPPQAILYEICNYINNSTFWPPNTMVNPYDPDQVRVECEYQLIGSSQTFIRHGFYTGKSISVSTTSDVWLESGAINPTAPSLIFGGCLFKMRFAPPIVGNYKGTVKMYKNNVLYYTYPEFTFNVTPTTNLGHLKLTGNPKVQKMRYDNGDVFYGIGRNVPYADFDPYSYYCSSSFPTPANPVNGPNCGVSYTENKAWPSTHQQQRNVIDDLAANDCNFTRIRLDRFSVPIEEKPACPPTTTHSMRELTNFYESEKYMWEMDKTLATCENDKIKILLTLESNGDFVVGPQWDNNPYSQLPGHTGALGRNNFFTSTSTFDIYKKKLYYIEARWGYSTSIAAWEIFNETELMGGNQLLYDAVSNSIYYKWTAFTVGNDVSNWLCKVKSYLQSSSVYPHHSVTNGTAYPPFSNASNVDPINLLSPSSTCLDFFVDHIYVNEMAGIPPSSGNPGTPAVYDPAIPALINIHEKWFSGYWQNPIINKPHLVGEHGLLGDNSILVDMHKYSKFTFHHQIWGSIFSNELTTALQWHVWKTDCPTITPNPFHYLYKSVKKYVDRINFNTLLLPDRNESAWSPGTPTYLFSDNTHSIQTLWMRTENKDTIYGWTRNTTSNWMVDGYPAVAATVNGPAWAAAVSASYNYNGVPNPPSLNILQSDMATVVQGLLPNTKYDVSIYDTWDPSGALLDTRLGLQTDGNGLLNFGLDMPYDLSQSSSLKYPDYAFVATLSPPSSHRMLNISDVHNDSLKANVNSVLCFSGLKNNTDSLRHSWSFGDGSGSDKANPCVTYTHAGTYNIEYTATKIEGAKEVEQPKLSSTILVQNQPVNDGVFPVPTKDKLYITIAKQNWRTPRFYIINSFGEMFESKLNPDNSIDLLLYNNGVYLLKIRDDKHEKSFKFIIDK